MPRIPESEIERIKRETDLGSLVRSRGVELKPHGSKDLAGKCPFHDDSEASFIITPEKNLFHWEAMGSALRLKNSDLRDSQDTGSLRSPDAVQRRAR